MVKSSRFSNLMPILYFDDKCGLCTKTVRYIKTYIKPENTAYRPLSESCLTDTVYTRAMFEMLLVEDENGVSYWGYDTYCKLFSLATTPFQGILRLVSYIMTNPITSTVGKRVYKLIANRRKRCSNESCNLI